MPSPNIRSASSICASGTDPCGSRNHCHLKYSHHIPSCEPKEICRSITDGLPYCVRLMLSESLVYVFSLNVQDHASPAEQPVGAPSFISGDCAARIGSKMNGVRPNANAPNTASTSRGSRNLRHRWVATVTTTASPGSNPAGCTAYPVPSRKAIATSFASFLRFPSPSSQLSINSVTIANSASEIVYTFSFTTD